MDVYNMLDDGKRVWNGYLAAVIDYKPAQIFHSLVMKYKYYEEHIDELKNRDYEEYTMLSQGWFYCTIDDLYKSTCMKYKSQTAAIKKLVELHLIEVKTGGLFNRRYFHIVAEGLKSLIEKGKEIINRAKKKFNIFNDEIEDSASKEQDHNVSVPNNSGIDDKAYPEVYDMLRENFKDSAIKGYIKLALRRGVNKSDVYDFISSVYARIEGRNIPKNNLRQYLYKSLQNEPLENELLEDPTFYIPHFSQPKKKEHIYDGEAIQEELLAQFRNE